MVYVLLSIYNLFFTFYVYFQRLFFILIILFHTSKEFGYIVAVDDACTIMGMFKNKYFTDKCTIENNSLVLETYEINLFLLNNLEMKNIKVTKNRAY